MARIKSQNYYSANTTGAIPASGDFSVTLTSAPVENKGWVTFDAENVSLRESVYFHSRSGSTISVKAENRPTPKAHASGATVKINNVAEMFEYAVDRGTEFGFVEKTGGLTINVFGGLCLVDNSYVTVADTALTLPAGQSSYIYFDSTDSLVKQTINVTTANLGVRLATVTTSGTSVSTIAYDKPAFILGGSGGGGSGGSVTSVNGQTGVVVLTKTDIGLANVDNTSDANKPVSTATTTALSNKVDKVAGKGLSTEDYTSTEKSKLAGIQAGATANSSDATLLNRANHTGTQTSSTISDFQESVEDIIGTKIVAGANVSVAYNDTTGETTISASGGGGGGGSGTVTSVSVVSANGLTGTVATPTTTPAITLSTSVAGLLKGGSGAEAGQIIQAFAGSDYLAPGTTTGDIPDSLNKRYVTDSQLTVIGNTSGTNSGDETGTTIRSKLGITTLSGSNTGDQTSIVGISGTKAQFDTACTDGNFMYTGDTATSTNALQSATTTINVSSATAPSAGQVLTATSGTAATWQTPSGGGGSSFWTLVPGTPIRTGNTTFTVTDTSNTNKYDLLLSRGVQIRWTESSVQKRAFIVSATYATNTVTITIVGDTMASIDASSMKYFVNKGQVITFQYPLTTAVGTDVASRFYSDNTYRVYGARAILSTAGTTGTLTVDINKNGTTMFTTKPTVASGANVGSDFTADNNTSLAVSDYVSIDIDAIHTTAGSGLQVQLYIGATYDTNLA